MKQSLKWAALLLLLGLMSFGCTENAGTQTSGTTRSTERTTTTTTTSAPGQTPNRSGSANVDVRPNRPAASGQTANSDRVDVDVAPSGAVDVDVQGEPIRDRIRERRAARNADLPR